MYITIETSKFEDVFPDKDEFIEQWKKFTTKKFASEFLTEIQSNSCDNFDCQGLQTQANQTRKQVHTNIKNIVNSAAATAANKTNIATNKTKTDIIEFIDNELRIAHKSSVSLYVGQEMEIGQFYGFKAIAGQHYGRHTKGNIEIGLLAEGNIEIGKDSKGTNTLHNFNITFNNGTKLDGDILKQILADNKALVKKVKELEKRKWSK